MKAGFKVEYKPRILTRILGWLEIAVALVVGVPTGLIYISYVVDVSLLGGQRDDIGIVRVWYPIFIIFALALGLAGRSLVKEGPLRWWAQIPWLLLIVGAVTLLD